jgi:hypothetical protein
MPEPAVRAILMVDDRWGANAIARDESPGILEQLWAFGWELTLVSPRPDPRPCAIAMRVRGGVAMPRSIQAKDVLSVAGFDALVVLPGQRYDGIMADPDCQRLLREAESAGLALGAFCRGVRVLAGAGLVAGKRITGHADYAAEYEAAGATFAGYLDLAHKSDAPPPVTDGLLVTSLRSRFFRTAMCEALRAAVSESRRLRGMRGV